MNVTVKDWRVAEIQGGALTDIHVDVEIEGVGYVSGLAIRVGEVGAPYQVESAHVSFDKDALVALYQKINKHVVETLTNESQKVNAASKS